jgi:hypothetical protein
MSADDREDLLESLLALKDEVTEPREEAATEEDFMRRSG